MAPIKTVAPALGLNDAWNSERLRNLNVVVGKGVESVSQNNRRKGSEKGSLLDLGTLPKALNFMDPRRPKSENQFTFFSLESMKGENPPQSSGPRAHIMNAENENETLPRVQPCKCLPDEAAGPRHVVWAAAAASAATAGGRGGHDKK